MKCVAIEVGELVWMGEKICSKTLNQIIIDHDRLDFSHKLKDWL